MGHATRHASALGLHLIITDSSVNEMERERRARTWYSLYALEVLLAEITGRPKSINSSDVTLSIDDFMFSKVGTASAPVQIDSFVSTIDSRRLWLDFLGADREAMQSMSGGVVPWRNFQSIGQSMPPAQFSYHLKLCTLSEKIAQSLYTGFQRQPWSETQDMIGELQGELRNWSQDLPDELNIQTQAASNTDPRAKLEVAMYQHSLEMILYRPMLCEVKIENQSERSKEFNRNCARACVHAAMSMFALMPDSPTAHEVYQLLPWWSLLHYVSQSCVVIILELCLDAQHFPHEIPQLVSYLRKGMAYLWCMTEGSGSAYKAWRIFRKLLTDVALKFDDLGIADIPEEAIPPPTWKKSDEDSLMEVSTVMPR